MRLLLVPALAVLFAAAPLVVHAADDTPAPITATLEKNANVRFGPTTSAKILVTLKAGDSVEVFGPSKASADWYVIRFPKQGKVWIHTQNLKALDGGERWQVTQDKTRARNDSTIGADVVAELNQGEIVEDKGVVNGAWRAVYIPDAVAYVHKSLINLPKDTQAKIDEGIRKAEAAKAAWEKSLATYTQYLEQVKGNPKAAIKLDWKGLADQLDVVIADHASASVRLSARRVRDSIAALVATAIPVAVSEGVTPPTPIKPVDTAKPVETTTGTAKPTTEVPTTEVGPRPLTPEEVAKLQAAKPKPSLWQAEGILIEDDQYTAKVGTRDVLLDSDSNVLAFIKTKDGVDLKLSELLGRYVGAKGEVSTIPPEQSGLTKPVKLVVAADVAPIRE